MTSAILQRGNELKEGRRLAQGHTASTQQDQDSNSGQPGCKVQALTLSPGSLCGKETGCPSIRRALFPSPILTTFYQGISTTLLLLFQSRPAQFRAPVGSSCPAGLNGAFFHLLSQPCCEGDQARMFSHLTVKKLRLRDKQNA